MLKLNARLAHIPQFRFIAYAFGLYTTFIYWGYLQEKLTTTQYSSIHINKQNADYEKMTWNYPFALNLCMSVAGAITAYFVNSQTKVGKTKVSIEIFWKAAITSALASPIGYASLQYITYPMMILTKSSKPVPVMLIGWIFYKRTFKWYKYVSVILLCTGIALFTAFKTQKHEPNNDQNSANIQLNSGNIDNKPWFYQLFGVLLIFINLCLDGYTNNEQDHIYSKYPTTSYDMMYGMNVWQTIYQFLYLLAGHFWVILVHFFNAANSVQHTVSELQSALYIIYVCPWIKYDIIMFCLCASLGQLLICGLIKEFGSLAWITLSVTRQFFTVLLSVFIFKHVVNKVQWLGILLVFTGLTLEAVMVYVTKPIVITSKSDPSLKLKDDNPTTSNAHINSSEDSDSGRIRTESNESFIDIESTGSEKLRGRKKKA